MAQPGFHFGGVRALGAGPSKPRAGPLKARVAPIKQERTPSKPERALQAREGPTKARAGPCKARAGPSKARAGPSKARTGPSKARAGPSKARAGPSKGRAGPSKSQSGPLKKPERPLQSQSVSLKIFRRGQLTPLTPPPWLRHWIATSIQWRRNVSGWVRKLKLRRLSPRGASMIKIYTLSIFFTISLNQMERTCHSTRSVPRQRDVSPLKPSYRLCRNVRLRRLSYDRGAWRPD